MEGGEDDEAQEGKVRASGKECHNGEAERNVVGAGNNEPEWNFANTTWAERDGRESQLSGSN